MMHQVPLLVCLLCCQVLALSRPPVGQKYDVVFPQKLHAQHKRDTGNKHPDVVQYGLELEGKALVIHLEKTQDLISDTYTETRYALDGTPITSTPDIQDHCYYQGHVVNESDSWMSISTCNGISGLILIRSRRFLISPLKQTDSEEHAVYPYEALEKTPLSCGVTNDTYTDDISNMVAKSISNAEKREFLKSKKYIELYIVADNSMFIKYNRTFETLKRRIFEIVNYVNVVYKVINTFVALTGIEIWETRDEFPVGTNASINLVQFTSWRQNILLPRKPHDNAQFITNIDFVGWTVGEAYVSGMCSNSFSAGVNQDHSTEPMAVGATLAHEMGHNLGMMHDEKNCFCPNKPCIMEKSQIDLPRSLSACSHQQFQGFIINQMPLCLKNMPKKEDIKAVSVCGNKFTEQGEDCDCGTVQECTNPCCDAATCKLKAAVQCAEGECCANCQIKNAGVICRPSKDDCDLADMCDGVTATCPPDHLHINGFFCNNGQGYCFNGKCPTLQSQCSALWGSGAWVENSCFENNLSGYNHGGCQTTMSNSQLCGSNDTKCGLLYCSGGHKEPTIPAYYSTQPNCKAVIDPRIMVENGTYCEDGKVCHGGKCTSIEKVYKTEQCATKCPAHAVCDSELQCQCEEGYAPPDCRPTSRPNYIAIFAVLFVTCLLIACVILVMWKRSKSRKQRQIPDVVSGEANPTFTIQEQGYRQPGSQVPMPKANQRPVKNTPYIPGNKPLLYSTQLQENHQSCIKKEYQRPAYKPPCPPVNKPPPPQDLKPRMGKMNPVDQ